MPNGSSRPSGFMIPTTCSSRPFRCHSTVQWPEPLDVRFVPKAEDQRGLRVLERPLGRPTRKYLKKTRSSPVGNKASHFRQAIVPCTASLGASIVTTLYSASQSGQLKSIGSDSLIVGLR